jgi:DNA-binding transcriptional MerR regulator
MSEAFTGEGASRRAAKSREAFRTISEVAADLNVPQHVLRFWETKFSQIRPLKRGGGRRYYRPEDVELLRRIRTLLYNEGYTIKGVQRVLREHAARIAPPEPARPAPVPPAAVAPAARIEAPAAAPLTPGQRTALVRLLEELRAIRALLADLEK